MRIMIMGTGYVGLTVGVGFAELGNEVICYDKDVEKIQRLQKGYLPIFEENMIEMLQKNRHSVLFTDDLLFATDKISVIIMTIGTPSKEDGDVDTADLLRAAEQLGRVLTRPVLIINKCTAPPGTTYELQIRLNQVIQSRGLNFHCRVIFNPEFLREGRALGDFFHPDRIVFGIDGNREIPEVQALFAPFAEQHTPIIYTQARTAELLKYVNNVVAALKVSFINEVANICEQESVNVWELIEILAYDKRISPQYLSPSIGFGGSCLPKDTRALEWIAKKANVTAGLIDQILKTNHRQIEMTVGTIQTAYPKGQLAILGTAFKAGTNDTRESPSIHVIKALAHTGNYTLHLFDPQALEETRKCLGKYSGYVRYFTDVYEACRGSGAAAVLTNWPQFGQLNLGRMKDCMSQPLIFDFHNVVGKTKLKTNGFCYYVRGDNVEEA